MPAMPIAMSVWPSRHALPKVSLTITAASTPAARKPARIPRAEASGSTGKSTALSWAPLDDWSTPLLAHTKPWWVSVIRIGPTWRTTRFASLNTISVTRGSLPHLADHSRANAEGSTSLSSIVRPSALDTILEVTTTTSPSARGVWADIVAEMMATARSAPLSISGSPATPKIWSMVRTVSAPRNRPHVAPRPGGGGAGCGGSVEWRTWSPSCSIPLPGAKCPASTSTTSPTTVRSNTAR